MTYKMPRIFIGLVQSGPYTGQWELFIVGYNKAPDGIRFFFDTCYEAVNAVNVFIETPGNPLHAWVDKEYHDENLGR